MYSNYTNSVKERANLGECGFEESDTLYTDRQPSKASLVLGTVVGILDKHTYINRFRRPNSTTSTRQLGISIRTVRGIDYAVVQT